MGSSWEGSRIEADAKHERGAAKGMFGGWAALVAYETRRSASLWKG